MKDFVAIDIETARGKRWSICQIGLAIVEDGKIIETITEYVQPPDNEYSKRNIEIHGITEADTADKPLFPDVWNKMSDKIIGKQLVAHNAKFDTNCLQQAFEFYGMEVLDFDCECTYKLTGKKLSAACEDMGISIENHHNAECDAVACAEILLKLDL